MSDFPTHLPPEQQAIQARCFHPSGSFVEFSKDEIEQSIPERFERIVSRHVDRTAVKTKNHTLTYGELNTMANRVAHAVLAQQGSRAEPVGLLLEKDAPLIAAMLGVLKAGKFFVLLDPSFPQARIATVSEDSQLRLVITNRRNASLATELKNSDCRLLEFESIGCNISTEEIKLPVSPTAFASIVYTSGSTGLPKGIVLDHRDLLHRIMLRTKENDVCDHDKITLLPTGTVNAVTNTLLALLNGAALLPFDVPKEGVTRLAGWLLQERISICPISSPLFRNLCETLTGKERFPDLRLIRLRSETVYKADVDLYKKFFSPACTFLTGLSTTETGQLTTYRINHETEIAGSEVPVGYAVEDKEILLLDDAGNEIGFNTMGEIAVKSRYLSPGYWRRPELTEAKFKPDSESGEKRLCLTGDLGLMLPDGCLIHKGRKDFRVKVRGYGVEFAEVEKALLEHAAVKEAVVAARQNESGEARLVAYLTSFSQPGPNVSELRVFLKNKLPEHMIPSAFVTLDAMPLTPNGKVDRGALPDPKNSRPDLDVPLVAAKTSTEEQLLKIWTEVLDLDQIGVQDNFFDLGGHSLRATQVISRVRKAFQVELPISTLVENPTVAALAGCIERTRRRPEGAEALSIQPDSRDGQLLLSFAQQRLWFLDQLEPGGYTYNLFSAYRLTGRVNVPALERSFNEIIRRHEVLRTVFKAVDGRPRQIVLPSLTIKVPIVDLREMDSNAERDAELRRLSRAEAQRPFDLACGPLLRVTLVRLTEEQCALLLAMHHIVFDGWSRGILAREMSVLYQAFSEERPSPAQELPIQYVDFAVWQRHWLQGQVLEEQISYWKNQLTGVPALQLPTDRPRPSVQSSCGARQYLTLSERLSAGLKDFSKRNGVTLFMTLLAAYQTLLHRYTHQDDIAIGSPIAGRNRSEVEDLIGFFLNTLILRTDLSGNPTFRELVARVRKVCLSAYAHQDLPFEKLVEELHPERSLSHNPLFQVTFAFQNTPRFPLELAGLTAEDLEVDTGIARFDLHLFLEEEGGVVRGYLDHDTDLFDASTIARMASHYQTLLEGIVHDPERRLSDLPLLTRKERHSLLVEWNDTQRDYPSDKCIHELFEAQVERTPDAVAVVFEDTELTYRELNRRANQLAHYLRKCGVGPEVLVAICVERSLEMVVGILGILKAGGAYVPLDPRYPKERLEFMLEDAQAPVLLTQDAFLAEFSNRFVLCLDRDWSDIAKESEENLINGATAENLAYVIYTSGSTGQPKAVMVAHRGLCNVAEEQVRRFSVNPDSRILQFSSLSFDASIFEIVMALHAGATLCLGSREALLPGFPLGQFFHVQGITIGTLPPSALAALPAEGLPNSCTINVAGEAYPGELIVRWARGRQFFNLYGPTEATIWATAAPWMNGGVKPPIGRPIANTEIYILDSHLEPVPVGVAGEIFISGAGLARGYLNRPELTAEKFIPNPFSDTPGARLYKTGDLARYLSDGNIEFLGRIDNQVKIRGFRIEPGEIEAVLSQHAAVREAVVVSREDVPGDPSAPLRTGKRLVAYLVLSKNLGSTTSELRGFLQQKLPDYMIPSAFVFLESLPLTPNGKIDRRALPAPDQNRPQLENLFVPPRTPVEETLAAILAEVLKLERVGIDDNFFDLGGHSLLAVQVVSRVRQAFDVDLPVRCLFEAPTVGGLAERIERARGGEQGVQAPPLLPVLRSGVLPLSFSQQRLWFLDQLEPGSGLYNVPSALRMSGFLEVGAIQKALDAIVSRHEALRTTFAVADGVAVQVIAEGRSVELSVRDLSKVSVSERKVWVEQLLREEARRPFDLSSDLMLRASLVKLDPEEHILLLVMHHIASDGWSMGILYRELSILYEAFSTGKPSALSELPVQYADFAVWQRGWLQGEVLERQLSYWKEKLAGIAVLELPTDRPRPAVQSYRGGRESLALCEALSEELKAFSRKEGATLFMTLLAAFQTLLHRYTGQKDIAVGSPIANRTRAELESLIGFFVNTLVLRTDVSGDPTLRELVARVRKMALEAYEHQDLPFEKLVEEFNPDRDLSRTPLFQVMFVLQNAPRSDLELPGLEVKSVRTNSTTAKFDLTLSIIEEPESLRASLEYSTDLFDAETIRRMLGHFRILLEGAVANPDRRLSDLPRMTQEECHQLLVEWNDTKRNYPQDLCLHELFERQTERTPDAIAVVFEEKKINYLELNRRANYVAQRLRELGIGPDVFVGICLERSIEMIVALLGILKAGGAYVPLDPAHPKDRLAFILQDSQAAVLLTEERLLDRLPALTTHVVYMDKEMARELESNPDSQVGEDNCAYVIYTSGSTGNPKGVMVEHRSLVNYLCWFNESPLAERLESLPAITTPTFDASLRQLFAPLLRGGQVWIVPNDIVGEPAALLRTLGARSSVGLNCVPSLWQTVLKAIEADHAIASDNNLSYLILGGEAFNQRLVEKTFAAFPDIIIWNIYGPTETTANASFAVISPGAPISIGRPISNTRIYIRDAFLEPVPIGVTGELHIGGAGLARGYLNRPDLTSEKFIPDPFSGEPGARLYKTGDLARFLPDGNIEFLGRVDRQVKIRGFRIELEEIETVLSQCPGVQSNVVIAREDRPGERQLAAYIVPDRKPAPTIGQLRSFLQQKLPEYMIPSAFVYLESLPLTPNGKVNRQALPPPDRTRPDLDRAFMPPRTPVEEVLAGIWREVLKIARVGIHDNFFELGGHSLLAIQVMSRVRQALQIDLPLRSLFEAPTVSGLAERIEKSRGGGQGLQTPPLLPISRNGAPPLSFAQQRLWFFDQFAPGSSVYNTPTAVRLRGQLNIGALEQSLNEMVGRHEALRTTFSTVEGEPLQIISPSLTLPLPVVDLADRPESEREEEALRLISEGARRPFDLARGPLLRAMLVRLVPDDHILLLNMHHIVSDGWSMGILYRELSILYEAFSNRHPSPLPELPIQYADFAHWQRNRLQGAVLEAQVDYWKRQLRDLPVLELATDRPRPAAQTYRGARRSIVMPKALAEALETLSRRQGVTLFMTLLAAFQTLLCRYTGQEDIAVGFPIANRSRIEFEGLIGFFLNTLVLRTDLSGDPSFEDLLGRVREITLEAYTHQDLPFEKLVEELQPERDLNRNPLFQVLFVLHNNPPIDPKFSGLTLSPVKLEGDTAKFDLSLFITPAQQGLLGTLEYSTDLFDGDTIQRMLVHFQTLLEGIAANPRQRISNLPLLEKSDLDRLLVDWNDTKTDYGEGICVHELFEAQVQRTPHKIAALFGEEQLTYRELDQCADRLARRLQSLGVGPEVRVGLCMKRSLETMIGLLAVLKAGGAYVPLDPAFPKERLAFMLEDAQVSVLLSEERLAGNLPEHRAKVIYPDKDGESAQNDPVANPASGLTPANLAYVIYTSGSTGKPKAVAMTHGPLCNLISWQLRNFSQPVPARTLQFASLSFDVSFQEIFTTWCSGGTLILIPDELRRDCAALLRLLREKSVARVFLPFVALQQLAEAAGEETDTCADLREIITAGEQLQITRPIASWFHKLKDCALHNQYGPSESHVVTAFTLTGSSGKWPTLPPIGRPIANTQIYLLDSHLQPVPVGVTGELYIGGIGLARSYLNRPELTAERFIPSPFSEESGARLYKTGDLARYLPDGNIEFLGRIDNQVKIRGFRIELGEIEAVLAQHPVVWETVVLAREDTPADKRLVAYVIPKPDLSPSTTELLSFLKEKLPDYMIPSAFVMLDTLPLTSNGKVDRGALPAPDQSRPEQEVPFVPPHTPTEKTIAEIWAQVLKLDKVGVHDNFFDLGGHSLLATQVVSRIRSAFNLELPLRSLFEKPTVAGLAEAIMQSLADKAEPNRTADILTRIESLSDEEAERLLSDKGT